MITINIIRVGQNLKADTKKLKQLFSNSKLIQVKEVQEINNPPYESPLQVSIDELHFITSNPSVDFSVVLIDKPLDNNFFTGIIPEKKLVIISLHNVNYYRTLDGITIEKFIMRFIYGNATLYKAYNNSFPPINIVHNDQIMQKNTQGCLFDICYDKLDIIEFFKNPKISTDAEAVLNTKSLPANYLNTLKTEIKKLKPSTFYQISSWIANNAVAAVFVSFLFGLISNVIANILTEFVK